MSTRIAQTAPKVCYEELLLQCFSDAYETDYEFQKVGNSSSQNFKEEHDALTIIMMILGIRNGQNMINSIKSKSVDLK